MNEDRETRPVEDIRPSLSLGNLDAETIALLIEDKIATGG